MRLHDPLREEQADPEPLMGAVATPLDLREKFEDAVALIGRDLSRTDPTVGLGAVSLLLLGQIQPPDPPARVACRVVQQLRGDDPSGSAPYRLFVVP